MRLQQFEAKVYFPPREYTRITSLTKEEGIDALNPAVKLLADSMAHVGVMPGDIRFAWGREDADYCKTHEKLHSDCPGGSVHQVDNYRMYVLVATGVKPAPGDDTEEPG